MTKLKHELTTVESRFQKLINENNMQGEDYRSQALRNHQKYSILKLMYDDLASRSTNSEETIEELTMERDQLKAELLHY